MNVADEILELVRIPSARTARSPDGPVEAAVTALILKKLRAEFVSWTIESTPFAPGRTNVYISGSTAPKLLFIGHLDTVETGAGWTQPPDGAIVGNRLYGRGSADMKAGVIAILHALRYAKEHSRHDVAALFYGDEEYNFAGMKDFVERYCGRLAPTLVICPEPSDGKLQRGCRGVLELRVTVAGRAGHAARTESGISAFLGFRKGIEALEQRLAETPRNDYLGAPTMNVTGVRCGVKTGNASELSTAANVIPDYCEATIEVRTTPGLNQDDVVTLLRSAVERSGCTLERVDAVLDLASFETSRLSLASVESVALASFGTSEIYRDPGVGGYSDVAMLAAAWKIPAVIWGPAGGGMHSPDEFVDLPSVSKLSHGFFQVIDSVCKRT